MLIYLLLINAAAFAVMLADKHRAKKKRWRVPEKVLFGIALIGGSPGCLLGMYLVRHKTKHKTFTIGMPVILILQAILLWWIHTQF